MRITISIVVRLLTGVLFVGSVTGCDMFGRQAKPIAASAETPTSTQEASTAKPLEGADAEAEEKEKQAEEDAKDARKLAKFGRDLDVARQKVIQARMAREHAEAQHAVTVAQAEQELELETQRLRTFTERSVPNRIEWSRLALVRAEDRVKENGEELKQLEMMYAEEDFADQTKEIVLERGRRRLERSQRDLELRREDFAILTEKTIPMETAEHELKVEQNTKGLEKARRDAEAATIEKKIGLMSGAAEVARLEAELEAHREKMEKTRRDREKKAKEQEAKKAGEKKNEKE